MRFCALLCVVSLALGVIAIAQDSKGGDIALTYHWMRTNAPTGRCGCFALQGGGATVGWNLSPHWSLLAEFSAESAGNALSSGKSLMLTSYLAGARYHLPQPWRRGAHSPQPFVHVLAGAAHATGWVAGDGDRAFAFASRLGGGMDVPLNSRIALRVAQIDYAFTQFANSGNDHQNNLLLGVGIVFKWGGPG